MELTKCTWEGSMLGRSAIALSLFLLAGCGSGDDQAETCEPEVVEGTPFFSSGTATLEGTGTLPAGIPDGSSISLLLDAEGFATGVLPDDIFDPENWWETCGRTFEYRIRAIDAGTYRLVFESYDDDSDEPEYRCVSTESFTIADGQTLHFDATFVFEP